MNAVEFLTCVLYFEIFRVEYRCSSRYFFPELANHICLTFSEAFDQDLSCQQGTVLLGFLWTGKGQKPKNDEKSRERRKNERRRFDDDEEEKKVTRRRRRRKRWRRRRRRTGTRTR